MADPQVLSVAVFDLIEGREQECLRLLREFYGLLRRKHYSRDLLLRDAKNPQRCINVRFWISEQARTEAAEDPEVHRYWAQLPNLLDMQAVYERLEGVPGFASDKDELY